MPPRGFVNLSDADAEWDAIVRMDKDEYASFTSTPFFAPRPLNLASLPPRPAPTPAPSPIIAPVAPAVVESIKSESVAVEKFWSDIKVVADVEAQRAILSRIESPVQITIESQPEPIQTIEEAVEDDIEEEDDETKLERLRKLAKKAQSKAKKAASAPFASVIEKINKSQSFTTALRILANRYGVLNMFERSLKESMTLSKNKIDALEEKCVMAESKSDDMAQSKLSQLYSDIAIKAFERSVNQLRLDVPWSSVWGKRSGVSSANFDIIESRFQSRRQKSKEEIDAIRAEKEYASALAQSTKDEIAKTQEERSEAFEKLANKEEIAKTLVKSKMCNSVLRGVPCARAVCNFAHSAEELTPAACVFAANCKCKDQCNYIHPGESKESYLIRMKISSVNNKMAPAAPIVSLPLHKLVDGKAEVKIVKCENPTGQCSASCPLHAHKASAPAPAPTPSIFCPLPESERKFTKVCSLFLQGKCFRAVCNFAHTYESFNPVCCGFNDRCRNKDSGCCFLHPSETKDSLCARLGYSAILATKPAPKPTPIVVAPAPAPKPVVRAPVAPVSNKSWASVAVKDMKPFAYAPVSHMDGKVLSLENDAFITVFVKMENVDSAVQFCKSNTKKCVIQLVQ
jgi:hypothetical protein